MTTNEATLILLEWLASMGGPAGAEASDQAAEEHRAILEGVGQTEAETE